MRVSCLAMLVVGLAFAACADDARPKDQWPMSKDELLEQPTDGDPRAATYRRYCVGCHGADGKGNSGLTGADFTKADSALLTRSDADLLASVRNGKRGVTATMPAHAPVLKDAEIVAVIAYVRERFTPAKPDAVPAAETGPSALPGSATGAVPAAAPLAPPGGATGSAVPSGTSTPAP